MICLRCDNERFVVQSDAVIEQEFKNERFEVHTPAMACSNCGWLTLDPDQTDELRRRTADAYRRKHGLLTSDEIKTRRKLLGMTQHDFAVFIGVGEASVKRWETWLVQENSSDQLIRMKCDKEILERAAQNTRTVWISYQCAIPTDILNDPGQEGGCHPYPVGTV